MCYIHMLLKFVDVTVDIHPQLLWGNLSYYTINRSI